jgi:pentose-5-phosphate-3-epimerase
MSNGTKPHVTVAVVMPLGPNDDPLDTIKSIRAYMVHSRTIIVVDDTHRPDTAKQLAALGQDVHVVAAGKLVTHSVRSWDVLDEQAIRGFFARRRKENP